MTNPKRSKGRPKGDKGRDDAVLYQIAAMKSQNPHLRIATALKKIKRKPEEREIRRIQAKWRMRGEAILNELKAQASAPPAASSSCSYGDLRPGSLNNAIRLAKELAESPEMKYIRDIQNNSAFRLAREIQNSPTMKLVQDLQKSPALKAARQAAELIRRLGM